jgi:hypothetical protein
LKLNYFFKFIFMFILIFKFYHSCIIYYLDY